MHRSLIGLWSILATVAAGSLWAEVSRVERGSLVLEGIPEIPREISDRFQQYQNTRSARLQGWHPSGEGVLISTRFGETRQIHWVKNPGGARHQLTFFDEPISDVAVVPDPSRHSIVIGKDIGGSEFYQLYLFDLETSTSRLLTDGKSRNGSASIANRGDRMAFFTTQRNGQDWDIHVIDLNQPGPSRPLLEKGGFWVAGEWSPDDRHLIVARVVSANEAYPYILDIESGELISIHEGDDTVAYSAVIWSHDGRGIYFASDQGTEVMQLRYFDLESRQREMLSGHIPWDIGQIATSPDGKWLAFTYNDNGIERFELWEAATRKRIDIPAFPVGQTLGLKISPDSKRLGLSLNTPQTPGDTYILELESRKLVRWTFSEVGGLDTDQFVVPELVHYETFDEVDGKPRQIPAFYYKPRHSKGPWPVLIDIHGGPEGQYRPFFDSETQFLIRELGIAVLAPNVRGSSGYGKSYLKLDNGYLREDSVKDIGKLFDWIEARPELDGERIAVMGGSYGGYMVLAAMTHFNDRLRGAIDIVGISNFVTFLENTEDYRRDLRRVEYGDERDPKMRAFLEKISPTTNAHKIKKPLLIVQGLNDPRVPVSEAEQILDVVRKNGGEPWYLLAKDEGHGFRKKSNRDYYNNAVALFLAKILFDESPAIALSPQAESR